MELLSPMNDTTYGFIQVIKKDGSDGGSCPILGDTTFGRDKEADIRIKLPQVSKEQAIIKVDENGRAFVVNLSKTNATILNGKSIEGIELTYLNHGDEIMMGERVFLFKSAAQQDTFANEKLVMKQVPKTESLDEDMTTNFSDLKESVLQDHSNILETIHESNEEVSEGPVVQKKKTPMKTVASPLPVKQKTPAKSPKASMNSIFDQIKARRKSGAGPLATSEGSQLAKSPMRIPTPKKTMITPLRKAIEARRVAIATPDDSTSKPNTPLSQKRTPSRRKSGCAAEFRNAVTLPAPTFNVPPSFLQKNVCQEETVSEVSTISGPLAAAEPNEESYVRPSKSSLLRQIEARRKSYSTPKTPSKTPSKTPTKATSSVKSKIPAKSPAGAVVAKAVVATLMEEIIAKRKKTPYKSPRKSINSIRAESAKKSSTKKSAIKKIATPKTHVEPDMDVVLPDEKTDEASVRVSLSKEEIIAASCTQLSVDALATKLEKEGNEASSAYETAVGAFLGQPNFFVPEEVEVAPNTAPDVETVSEVIPADKAEPEIEPIIEAAPEVEPIIEAAPEVEPAMETKVDTPKSTRKSFAKVYTPKSTRKSLSSLQTSLQKAGASSAVKSEVIADMSEQELDMIDAYATQIEASSDGVIDKNESYAVAMDSFIRGVEQANITIPKDESAFYGASLTNLFKEKDEDDDQALIAVYAEELQEAACIDLSVAYGIALDTYLADPVIFRERLNVRDSSIEETVVKPSSEEMMIEIDSESTSVDISSEVFDAATPVKSAQKSAKKSSVKKSVKKSAAKNVSNTPLTKFGENSIFSPPAQGSPFVKAVSAVKEAVTAVWEAVVASPARSARQSIGNMIGSPKISVDVEKPLGSSDHVDKDVEPMEVQDVVQPDMIPEPESEQEAHPSPTEESDVVTEVAVPIKSPMKKVSTPKSAKKTPKSVKKSGAKKAASPAAIQQGQEIIREENQKVSPSEENLQEAVKNVLTKEEVTTTVEAKSSVKDVVVEEKTTRGKAKKATLAPASKKGSKKGTLVADEAVKEENVEPIVEAKATRGTKRKVNIEPATVEEPVVESRKGGSKKAKKVQEEAVFEEALVEEKTTRGRAKKATPVPEPAPKRGSKKAISVVAEVVEEEDEDALVLICDGCENEFFYDELYPKGDFQIPEGDWFCISCEAQKKKTTKYTKVAPKKSAPAKKAAASVKGKKAVISDAEEAPKRSTRRK